MGRSRITRTFHNKPTSKAKTGSKISRSFSKTTKPKVIQTVKPKPKSKGLIPQAHAQEAPKQKTKSKKEPLEGQNLGSLNVSTQILSRHTQNQGSHNYHGFTPLHGDGPHNSNWSLGSDDVKHISGRTKSINKQRVGYFGKQQGSHLNQSQYTTKPVSKTTKQKASSIQAKPKSKGLIPQAHAQEELPAGTMLTSYTKDHLDQARAFTPDGKDAGVVETVVRTKTGFRAFGKGTSGKEYTSISLSKSNIKKEKYASGEPVYVQYGKKPYTPASNTEGRALDKKYGNPDETATGKERTILGKFAQGVSNEAQDIGGVPYGLVTGQDYKTKSILSRATEHAFAGDWGSAGKVISDNPYRFAGNVATNIGLSIIPFGMVARGTGLAGKAGKVVGKLKGKRATVPGRSGPIKKSGLTPDSQGNWVNRPAAWPLRSADKVKGVKTNEGGFSTFMKRAGIDDNQGLNRMSSSGKLHTEGKWVRLGDTKTTAGTWVKKTKKKRQQQIKKGVYKTGYNKNKLSHQDEYYKAHSPSWGGRRGSVVGQLEIDAVEYGGGGIGNIKSRISLLKIPRQRVAKNKKPGSIEHYMPTLEKKIQSKGGMWKGGALRENIMDHQKGIATIDRKMARKWRGVGIGIGGGTTGIGLGTFDNQYGMNQ